MGTNMPNDRDSAVDPYFSSDVEQLRVEVKQLRQDNEDLRESALWWQRLYEAAIERMNGSQQLLSETSHQNATITACVEVAAIATTIQQRSRFSARRNS
jgi:hypothetical protein